MGPVQRSEPTQCSAPSPPSVLTPPCWMRRALSSRARFSAQGMGIIGVHLFLRAGVPNLCATDQCFLWDQQWP